MAGTFRSAEARVPLVSAIFPCGNATRALALQVLLATTTLFACQPNPNPTPTPVPRVPTPTPEPNREPDPPVKPHTMSDTSSQIPVEDVSTQYLRRQNL